MSSGMPEAKEKLLKSIAKKTKSAASQAPIPKQKPKTPRQRWVETKYDDTSLFELAKLDELLDRIVADCDTLVAGESVIGSLKNLANVAATKGIPLGDADVPRCMERLLRLRTSNGGIKFVSFAEQAMKGASSSRQGYINAFAGELRERVVQYLPDVAERLDEYYDAAVAAARSSKHPHAEPFDSGVVGEVRMATSPASGTAPNHDALGPDRLFGFIVPRGPSKQSTKKLADPDAPEIAGALHVTGVVEIKARTGLHSGINQTQAFFARSSHGQVTIDGKVYDVVIDEKAVRRTVVFPADAKARRSGEKFAAANGIDLVPYSAEADRRIIELASETVADLIKLERILRDFGQLTGKAAQKAAKAK